MPRRIFHLFISLIFIFCLFTRAQAQKDSTLPVKDTMAETPHKDTVKVGVYITSIYNLGFAENDFGIDFWVWYLYKNDSIDPKGTMEVVNAESQEFENGTVEHKGNYTWAVQKCRATIKKNWEISRFPLDDQTLDVYLEETDKDTSELVYVADVENSKIEKSVSLNGWHVSNFTVRPSIYTYNTTFGDPTLSGNSSYARLSISTKIERESKSIFLKLFLGLYVAFLIALAVFFLDGAEIGARTSLAVGALFAAVGNKYIVDSSLPDHASFTIVDKIHDMSFALILISIVFSIISNRFAHKGDSKKSNRFDLACFFGLLVVYVIAHLAIIRP
ncbi:MAG TPA: hypothetical protein VFU15_05630 [Bacteroidia bacterium]|nr:hypothetical protein [Bacteroidia bacterium]